MQHSYEKLAECLKTEIRNLRYQVGEKLPSVRHYAATHEVSVSTAIRCYRHLESQGYVESRPKSGIYVADWKALQKARSAAVASIDSKRVAPVEYDKLASLQHRMTELYSLTNQPLRLGLHLANAAPQWYPCETLARIGQRVLRGAPLALGAYPTGTGLPALKTELISYLASFGVDLSPNELLITNGSTEALQVALRCVTQPGDTVVVESPVYFGLLQMIDNLGLKALEIPCVPGLGISLEALEYALEHHHGVRAVVAMPNFQNPLCCTMPETAKRRLLRLVEKHNITLIEDDVFGDLSNEKDRPQPIKAWDRQGRVIYCGSCSKNIAPAFRLGWIAGGRFQSRLESLKLSSSLATPLFEQAVLAEFMKSGGLPSHLRKLRERMATNVPVAIQAVQQHFPAGTQVRNPSGGWWLWIEIPEPVDTMSLLRQSVQRGIAFTPGVLFSTSARYSNCLRLNISRPWDAEMAQCFKTLGALARTLLA